LSPIAEEYEHFFYLSMNKEVLKKLACVVDIIIVFVKTKNSERMFDTKGISARPGTVVNHTIAD
jgi:hypothetical protein